jgi:hypothetical protein
VLDLYTNTDAVRSEQKLRTHPTSSAGVRALPGCFTETPAESGKAGMLGTPEVEISTRNTHRNTRSVSLADITQYSSRIDKL